MDIDFRSKVDLWVVLLTVGAPVLALDFFLDDTPIKDSSANLITLLIVVLVLCLFAGLYFTTRYRITSELLLVRSGPFSWVVSLSEISSIEPTHSLALGPALSLDRLLIHYGENSELLVSPTDKQGFVAAIKKRAGR